MSEMIIENEGRSLCISISSGSHDFAVADVISHECDECDGTGKIIEERDKIIFVKPCTCSIGQESCAKYNAARIPRRLASKTFENFMLPPAKGTTSERLGSPLAAAEAAYARVRSFVDSYGTPSGRLGFVLMGPVGTGKSHLLAATLRVLAIEKRINCRYVEFFHLLSDLKDGYSSGKSEMEIIAPLCAVDVLAVDELGKGRGSDWEMYVLDEIISRRYNSDKVTLFATNYTDKQDTTLKSKTPQTGGYVRTRGRSFSEEIVAETLEDRVGERIFSRLHEMCDFIPCRGPDFRKTGFYSG